MIVDVIKEGLNDIDVKKLRSHRLMVQNDDYYQQTSIIALIFAASSF